MALGAVGSLLIVAGLLVHFYVVPVLAVFPADENTVTTLAASGATIFDTSTLKDITTDLTIKARTVGDVAASEKAPDNAVVWVNTTTVTSGDGVVRSQSTEQAAFDKRTGMAVDCCGNFDESAAGKRVPVVRTGLVFIFPFDTQKTTYPFWDSTTGKAVATSYVDTTTLDGMKVYVFQNTVPASVVGHQSLPASLLGLSGNGSVRADSMYQATNTYYVEPASGAILNQVTDSRSWFAADGGQLVTNASRVAYTPEQTASLVHQYKGKVALLKIVTGIWPWVVAGIGLLLVAGAMLLRAGFLGRRSEAPEPASEYAGDGLE